MIDSLLKARLQAVADRQRQLQLWSKLAACWAIAAIVGILLILLAKRRKKKEPGEAAPTESS